MGLFVEQDSPGNKRWVASSMVQNGWEKVSLFPGSAAFSSSARRLDSFPQILGEAIVMKSAHHFLHSSARTLLELWAPFASSCPWVSVAVGLRRVSKQPGLGTESKRERIARSSHLPPRRACHLLLLSVIFTN